MLPAIIKSKILCITENKLKEFNYKVLSGILSCNYYLSKWKPAVDGQCEICQVNDDIFHLIYNCKLAKSIWSKLELILHRNILPEHIVLGLNETKKHNQLFTLTAFVIYKYWVQTFAELKTRNIDDLYNLVKQEFLFRSQIYQKLGFTVYYELLQTMARSL